MRTSSARAAILLAPLFLMLLLGSLAAQVTVVRVAVDATGQRQAWLSARTGLFVTGWSAAPGGQLDLGHGSFPRFDVNGSLYFVRGLDDGHRVVATTYWLVPAGSARPVPLADASAMPPYVLPPLPPARSAMRICIDPGHGGSDPGATGFGYQEKAMNLDTGLRLKAWLDRDTADTSGGGSWTILMTRTDDSFVSLSQRANMANAFGAASFLSIHQNAFSSSSANGTETYCMTGQEANAGGQLRNRLHGEAIGAWGLRNRGTKSANFAVLRLTAMPASLLECGFITSPVDIAKISDPAQRDVMALHCLYAWQQHHGFGRFRPGGGGGQIGTLKGVLYNASQGTSARLGGGTVALPDGTFVVSRSTDGYFEFTVPAGGQAYGATLPGFTAQDASRTVPAGGEVWGSLGMVPGNVPSLTLDSFPQPLAPLSLRVRGDVGSPVFLVVAATPGIPVVSLGSFGLGVAWPSLAGVASVNLGTVSAGGVLSASLRAPSVRGLTVHCQAVVRSGGGYRLTNGGAFTVQ